MFALMNPDFTVARITGQQLDIFWNQCHFQNLNLVDPATRYANLIYDFVPANPGDAPIGQRWGNSVYAVNQAAGTVTESLPLVAMTTDEAAAQLAQLQSAKKDAISAYRDNLHLNGGVLVGANWFGTDSIRRSQWLGLMLLGANIPAGVNAFSLDGVSVPLNQALVQAIFGAIVANDAAQVGAAQGHVAAMMALPDPRTYVAYNDKANWPAAYTS